MKDDMLALHGVAIKKHGTTEDIAMIAGLPPDRVEEILATAVTGGRAVDSGGRYALTPAGAMILKTTYARAFAKQRSSAAFIKAYEAFERINVRIKDLISAWQTMEIAGKSMPNDHSDKGHDEEIIFKLGDLHEKTDPILTPLEAELPRLTRYRTALLDALEKAEDGDVQWVSDARIDSYHTVWFELHEDLLRIVGRDRLEA